MFESLMTVLCIFSICFLVYAFQMRNRIINDNYYSCDTLYYPENEKIITPPLSSSPYPESSSNPESSPINYRDYLSSPDFDMMGWYG